jgi:hypothetical protein
MKKLVLFSVLVLSLTTHSQVLKVSLDTIQEMSWPLNVTLSEAEKYDLVEYTNLSLSNSTYTFDLNKKKANLLCHNGVVKQFNLVNYTKSKTGYNFELTHGKYTTKFTVTEQVSGGYVLVVMFDYEKGDTKSEGYFSRNVKVVCSK